MDYSCWDQDPRCAGMRGMSWATLDMNPQPQQLAMRMRRLWAFLGAPTWAPNSLSLAGHAIIRGVRLNQRETDAKAEVNCKETPNNANWASSKTLVLRGLEFPFCLCEALTQDWSANITFWWGTGTPWPSGPSYIFLRIGHFLKQCCSSVFPCPPPVNCLSSQ